MILTKKYLEDLTREYEEQQRDIKDRLERIRAGKPFGEPTDNEEGYYPATLIEVMDEETGLIYFREDSTDVCDKEYVSRLYVGE